MTRARELGATPGGPSMLLAMAFGLPCAAAMYGVGWVVARGAAGGGDPFTRPKLVEIAAQVAGALARDGGRRR